MKQADRIEGARLFLADLPDSELANAAVHEIEWACRLSSYRVAERLINAEKLKRGLITLRDLTPEQRRAQVDKENLDVHALASGPIMDAANLYCPLGKLSMAETRAREAACVISAQGEAHGRG